MNKLETYHVKEAALYALKNQVNLGQSTEAGCYYCCQIFPTKDIQNWTDQSETAICPKCSVDAVLPGSLVPLTIENLKTIHGYWFKQSKKV